VALWDLEKKELSKVLAKVPATVYALHYLNDQELFFIGQREGGIHIIDMEQKKEVKLLQFHEAPIFDIKTVPRQDTFYAVAGDGKLSAWSLDTFDLLHEVQLCKQENVRFMDLNTQQTQMAVACSDNTIRIIDVENFEQTAVLKSHERSVFCTQYHPGAPYLLSGALDARLNIWDIENNFELAQCIPAHYFTINSIVFSPDQQFFATGSRDRTIKIWDAKEFQLLKVINYEKHDSHRYSVNRLYWSHYNDYLISGSDDGHLMLWQIEIAAQQQNGQQ
jgi:WD40 repeat protein